MPTSANNQLANSFITLTANMQRLSQSEILTVVGTLKQLETELANELLNNPKLTDWTKRRYSALISQNQNTIAEYYKSINAHHQAFLTGVGGVTQAGVANAFVGIGVPLPSVAITTEQFRSIASTAMVNGAPSSAWWAKQSQGLRDAFAQQMRIGYAGGETVDQLVQRVRGTATGRKNIYFVDGAKKVFNEFQGGIMDTGTRQAEALVRTSVQQMSNDAKMEVFRANKALLKGVMWVATLDSRTTLLCSQRSGKLYDLEGKPIGHNYPFLGGTPAHWNAYVADENVATPVGVCSAMHRRAFEGDIIVIRGSSIGSMSVTPYHPVLTLRGWVFAGEIQESDKLIRKVFSDVGELLPKIDIKDVKAGIYKSPDPVLFVRNPIILKMPVSSDDFHGDISADYVTTVFTDYDLLRKFNPSILKNIPKDAFFIPNKNLVISTFGQHNVADMRFCFFDASDTGVCGFGACPPFFRSHFGNADRILRFAAPSFNPQNMEPSAEHSPITVEDAGSFFSANPAFIQFQDMIQQNIISVGSTDNSLSCNNFFDMMNGDIKELCRNICVPDKIIGSADLGWVRLFGVNKFSDIFPQELGCGFAANSVFVADFGYGSPTIVEICDIENINVRYFSGHVHDLQCDDAHNEQGEQTAYNEQGVHNSGGCYFVNGILTHNCRSTLAPITKSWEELGAAPGTDKAWYEALDPGMRSSLDGYLPDVTTFESWFDGLSEADQIAYLGPKKYEIFRDAGLSVADMADQFGNPLTLQALADAYGYRIEEYLLEGMKSSPVIQQSAIGLQREIDIRASELALEQIERAQKEAVKAAQADLQKLIETDPYAKGTIQNLKNMDAWPDDVQSRLVVVQAAVKEEQAIAAQLSEIQTGIKADIAAWIEADTTEYTANYLAAKEAELALESAVGKLPSEMLPQYQARLASIQQQNKTITQALTTQQAENPFLQILWNDFKDYPQYTPWDMTDVQTNFTVFVQNQEKAAAKKLIAFETAEGPIVGLNKLALQEAKDGTTQGLLGSNTATLAEFEKVLPSILQKDAAASIEISKFSSGTPLQQAAFAELEAMKKSGAVVWETQIQRKTLLENMMTKLELEAADHLKSISVGTDFGQFVVKQGFKPQNYATMFDAKLAVQALEKDWQASVAKLAQEAIKTAAGTAEVSKTGLVQLGGKSYDLTMPQELGAFKKAKSQWLSHYKKAVVEGKMPPKGALQAYEILSAEEKTAFNAKLKLAAESTKPITMNAVPEPGTLQWNQLEYIKPKDKGSVPGAWYRDRVSGIEYLVKHPLSDDIARNEVLASHLYRAAGVDVPELTLIEREGRLSVASRAVAGIEEVNAARLAKALGTHENFAVDAWLANWDVIGLDYDNTVLLPSGTAFRIDVGGALRYRAQGGLKGAAFGQEVTELASLRSATTNKQAYDVFKNIKKADIETGVKKVLALEDDAIRGLVKRYGPIETAEAEALADLLIARKANLAKQFPHLVELPVAPLPADASRVINASSLKAIENSRINGYAVPVDRRLIEDQSALIWHEKNTAGHDVTGLKLKITDEARDIVRGKINIVGGAVEATDIPYRVEQSYAEFKIFLRQQWNVHHNQLGKVIDSTLAKDNMALLGNKFDNAVKAIGNYDAISAQHFRQTFTPIMRDIEKSFAQQIFNPLGVIADTKFNESALFQYKVQPKKLEEAIRAAGLEFREVAGEYKLKKVRSGFATQSDRPLVGKGMPGGVWERVLEADMEDGTRIRLWFDERHGGWAIRNTVEIMTPGKAAQDVTRLLSIVEKELGIAMNAPGMLEQEEMYLRMIARAQNKWSLLNKAELPSFADEKTVEQRVKQWRKWLSKEMGVDDITKLEGYNPFGIHEPFDSGRRRWYLPGVDRDADWQSFFSQHSLHHSTHKTGAEFLETIDTILNGGGTMTNTTEKLRKGIPWGGLSPGSDMSSGGAEYFFTRVFNNNTSSMRAPGSIVWDSKHVTRLDAISYDTDKYGRTTGDTVRKYKRAGADALRKLADVGNNETIFKHGLSLFDGLKHINVGSAQEAESLLQIFAKHGWRDIWIDGRRINEIVHLNGAPYYPG